MEAGNDLCRVQLQLASNILDNFCFFSFFQVNLQILLLPNSCGERLPK